MEIETMLLLEPALRRSQRGELVGFQFALEFRADFLGDALAPPFGATSPALFPDGLQPLLPDRAHQGKDLRHTDVREVGDLTRGQLASGCELDDQKPILTPSRRLLAVQFINDFRHVRAAQLKRSSSHPEECLKQKLYESYFCFV
jgi:hypothetical protein